MNPETFLHPLTYEVLPGDESSLADAVEDAFIRVKALKREIADVMARLDPLRLRLAELRGPAVLPARRHRTPTQELTASCPRCGGSLDAGEAA